MRSSKGHADCDGNLGFRRTSAGARIAVRSAEEEGRLRRGGLCTCGDQSVRPDEEAFEKEIADWLIERGGYEAGAASNFDAGLGLDTSELAVFIGATQAEDWNRLVMLHGGGTETAQQAFYARLAAELDKRGTVDVLRRGVIDHGVLIRLAYFRPAHGLTPELVQRHQANRLTVTRQLEYEQGSTKKLDLTLFVNGLPVATAEIKNQLTGQTADDAKAQYRNDRDPRNVTLSRRAVVHFAVDTEQVAMTTRLAGAATKFLPFNRGHDGGAGNPAVADGHRSSYLWRNVWSRDNWLDLLQRFVHVEKSTQGGTPARRGGGHGRRNAPQTAVIFPRYHQWEAVLLLEAAARAERAGHDYLVAALGWLGQVQHHRLAGPPVVGTARCRGRGGVQQGRRHHRPQGPGQAAPGHDLPVRSRPRRGREDR